MSLEEGAPPPPSTAAAAVAAAVPEVQNGTPMLAREGLRLPLLADAAMAVAVNGAAAVSAAAAAAAAAVAGGGSVSVASTTGSSSAAAAAPTLTTPTLTPTTLRNIEQMFMDSENQVPEELRPPDVHEHSARFEPPTVSLHESETEVTAAVQPELPPPPPPPPKWIADGSVLPGPHSNEDDIRSQVIQAAPLPVRLLPTEPLTLADPSSATVAEGGIAMTLALPPVAVPPPLPTQPLPVSSIAAVTTAPQSVTNPPPSLSNVPVSAADTPPPLSSSTSQKKRSSSRAGPSSGGRRPAPTSGLSPEEERKKILRRLRNKEAAARCRKRRLDQTMQLQDEVDRWEARNADLHEEIRALEAQRGQLEAALDGHKSACRVESHEGRQIVTFVVATKDVKEEEAEEEEEEEPGQGRGS